MLLSEQSAADKVILAANSHKTWNILPLSDRQAVIARFIDHFLTDRDSIAKELSQLIGRPHLQCNGEIKGFEQRARYLLRISRDALKDITPPDDIPGFKRYIKRESLGVVLIISAWNYPYLIMVNGIIPALLAGNTVIIKQAPETFKCADRLQVAFEKAGLPLGVFQALQMDIPVARTVLLNPLVKYVHFTGSVRGGQEISQILSSRFIGLGLELGGNDSAYVRADCDPKYAAENLVDGAMFNSGQSCCGIQRIYVHEAVYDSFVKHCESTIYSYVLGDPSSDKTTLGPLISIAAADSVREIIRDSVKLGAVLLIDENKFPVAKPGSAFVAPQVLLNVTHEMVIMREECFGPVVGIMKVKNDEEAILLMNDSQYGLTASIWTVDTAVSMAIGDRLDVGTIFQNRCDYLDPGLPWTGVKNSGRGSTLSHLGFFWLIVGFDQLTRPKGYHLRVSQ